MEERPQCAECQRTVCYSEYFDQGPDFCPTKTKADVIERALANYSDPQFSEFARIASQVEGEGYMRLPLGRAPSPVATRVEEIINFSKKMGYRKLGIAFCIGLRNEARTFASILENRGFEVVSVCCKVGGIPKESIGIEDEEKITPGSYESMCNPIAQAEILNDAGCDFNIAVGLCVGHDSLFLKHVKALTTVLIAKDRVFAHNPAAALYQSTAYYRRLLAREEG